MLLYFIIFISKIIENALSTLRMIVVSNGKKKLGAFLNEEIQYNTSWSACHFHGELL